MENKAIQQLENADITDLQSHLLEHYRNNLDDIYRYSIEGIEYTGKLQGDDLHRVKILVLRIMSDIVSTKMYERENWNTPIYDQMNKAGSLLLELLWFHDTSGIDRKLKVRDIVIPIIEKCIEI